MPLLHSMPDAYSLVAYRKPQGESAAFCLVILVSVSSYIHTPAVPLLSNALSLLLASLV
jgi:hypothetical protein